MNNTVNLFFAGDFCSKPSTTNINVSEDLRDIIQSCELKVVNFEVPLKPDITLPPQQYERFWQNDDVPVFLKDLGFNLFSIANNHAFDWGIEGYKKTKAALGEASFGAGAYDEAYRIKVREINGIKIGFLALSYAAYTGVFDDVLHHDGLGCAYINDLRVNHDILEAKKKVDYLFVLPHDGIEYIDVPLPETIARYRDFIDYGADGVIGSHPHCPQGWEEYKGKPIFYSLGNFFFNSKDNTQFKANKPHWYEGLCLKMVLKKGEINYQILNTRNIDNVKLILDEGEDRIKHNQQICSYLVNQMEYESYLNKQCRRLAMNQEIPILDKSFHDHTLKECTKLVLKNWLRHFKGKSIGNNFSIRTLLRNDNRRNLLLRGIKE